MPLDRSALIADNEFEPIEKCVFVRAIYLIREIRNVVTSSSFYLTLFIRDKMLQSRGINDLLAAEKKAQVLIEEARKRKNKRLKDAQTEAKTEVDQIKTDRDQQYKQLEGQVNSIPFVFSSFTSSSL